MRIKSTRNNSIEAKPSAMNHLCQIALGLVFFVLAGCGGGGNEVIGIDLGTTNSCVAVMEGKVIILQKFQRSP